jgi:SAM-dependent methyltransferase
MVSLRQYRGKQLVSVLRNGDYAHAGEEEAIRCVMEPLAKNPQQTILDIGCGLGGTAHFLQQEGWGIVSGFDIEPESIAYAKQHYPGCTFYIADATCKTTLPLQTYDILSLFNVFYAFDAQLEALKNFAKLAHTNTHLILFDYASDLPNEELRHRLGRQGSLPFRPIQLTKIESMLIQTDWTLTKIIDQTTLFHTWYQDLVTRLEDHHKDIIENFGQRAYEKAHYTYSALLDAYEQGFLQGVTVYASH